MDKIIDTLQIKISKARENLSQESRNAIDSVSWKLILEGINKNYTAGQILELQTETELLLCGLVATNDFPKELEERLKISRAEALLLLGEMDKQIFKKIQLDLERRLDQKEKAKNFNKSFVFDPRFQHLQRHNQEAIFSSDWKQKLLEVTAQFKINIEQQGFLEDITADTLAGTIHASDYEKELKSKIGLPDDKNKEMVAVLNEKIFKKVKELLMANDAKKSIAPPPPYMNKKETPKVSLDILPEDTKVEPPHMVVQNIDIKKENEIELHKEEDIKKENSKVDMYREHGIEIISGDDFSTEKSFASAKDEYIANKNKEMIKSIEAKGDSDIVRAEKHSYAKPSIMANKLMNSTISNSSVTDYSLPKIGGAPHDPYHEEV